MNFNGKQLSTYNSIKDYTPNNIPITDLITVITSNTLKYTTNEIRLLKCDKEAYDEAKRSLPVIIPSALMNKGTKGKDNINEHSTLIWLDIDIKDDGNEDIQDKVSLINADEHTFASWTSISGGLKIVVRTNIMSIDDHLTYWTAVKEYYENKFNINCDDRPKAPTSFCFINYDVNYYSRVQATIFKVEISTTSTPTVTFSKQINNTDSTPTVTFSKSDITILNYKKYVDESLFEDKQKPIFIGRDGLATMDLKIQRNLSITDGRRYSTLSYFTMCLKYNNLNISFNRLKSEIDMLNRKYCYPTLEKREIYDLVNKTYNQIINYNKYEKIKYIFYSKKYEGAKLTEEQEHEYKKTHNQDWKRKVVTENKMKLSRQIYNDGMKIGKEQDIYNVIENSDIKITNKIIANILNVTEKTIKKRMTQELKDYKKIRNVEIKNKC